VDQIEAQRARYSAELTSFSIQQAPLVTVAPEAVAPETVAPEAAAGGEQTLGAVGTPAGSADDTMVIPTPVRTDVVLDILVSTEGEPLPGITLEFEHVGADQAVKEQRLLWVDTRHLVSNTGVQLSQVVEDVDYQEGDGFHVSVRSPVPEAERVKYQELAGAQH
jgi:hypothetical protein